MRSQVFFIMKCISGVARNVDKYWLQEYFISTILESREVISQICLLLKIYFKLIPIIFDASQPIVDQD